MSIEASGDVRSCDVFCRATATANPLCFASPLILTRIPPLAGDCICANTVAVEIQVLDIQHYYHDRESAGALYKQHPARQRLLAFQRLVCDNIYRVIQWMSPQTRVQLPAVTHIMVYLALPDFEIEIPDG